MEFSRYSIPGEMMEICVRNPPISCLISNKVRRCRLSFLWWCSWVCKKEWNVMPIKWSVGYIIHFYTNFIHRVFKKKYEGTMIPSFNDFSPLQFPWLWDVSSHKLRFMGINRYPKEKKLYLRIERCFVSFASLFFPSAWLKFMWQIQSIKRSISKWFRDFLQSTEREWLGKIQPKNLGLREST